MLESFCIAGDKWLIIYAQSQQFWAWFTCIGLSVEWVSVSTFHRDKLIEPHLVMAGGEGHFGTGQHQLDLFVEWFKKIFKYTHICVCVSMYVLLLSLSSSC